ncbi:MAG TPA: hypothetical protein VMM58_07595 [Bacteroidota bacterium]|nr:hypothetical protein [Bacteroidota bacterium]
MTPSTASSTQKFSSTSLRHLRTIEEIFFNSGLGRQAPQFFNSFHAEIARSADDAMATTNFVRFLEASFNKTTILHDLADHPVLLETLMLIFSSSQYFSDTLIRDPELFRWLTASNVLEAAKTKSDFFSAARQSIEPFQTLTRKLNVLKRFQRREMLRIGMRDMLQRASLKETTRELSHLADVIIMLVAELTWHEMSGEYGDAPHTAWTIIALGKLGGEELNYSSDIDLMSVFDEDGEIQLTTGGRLTHGEFFVRFIERVVESLMGSTEEGYFYRVDMRLRPDGKSGALIRSLGSTMTYYESRGELWERQMLIKARPVAGDDLFAKQFLHGLSPFIYPRTFLENPIEEIARIKTKIESRVEEHNIKLRSGGIRDIEFAVQALQLINGGKNPAIRSANTLEAITLLRANNLIAPDEEAQLREAYIFLRVLEHRLQMLAYAQTHSLPASKEERKKFALRMGLTAGDFEQRLETHQRNVRRIFNAVFTHPHSDNSLVDQFLSEQADSKFSLEFARRFNFRHVEKTLTTLRRLMFGTTIHGKKEYPERTRTLFRNIAEQFLAEIASTPLPDRTLAHCERMLSSFSSPDAVYSLLREQNFRKAFVGLCAKSGMLANRFALSPSIAETLLTNIGDIANDKTIPSPLAGKLYEWKSQEECKAVIRYVLLDQNEERLFRSFSEIADSALSAIFTIERKNMRLPSGLRFCILGLGKLGGKELGLGSDLDLLFLFSASKKNEAQRSEELSSKIMTACSRMTSGGKLYDVDARLRPEGRNAPLAVAEEQYLDYLQHRASLWERQSLTRARFVAGNAQFATEALNSIHSSIYGLPLTGNWVDEIISMRVRTETRSRVTTSELLDIKLGRGGLMDAEFTIQALQLSRGTAAFGSTNMYELLAHYSDTSPMGRQIGNLEKNYRMFRRVEAAIRIGLDAKSYIIPTDDDSLSYLSKLLGHSSSDAFLADIRSRLHETRSLFESIMSSLR